MKNVRYYHGRNRTGNLLHIETDGCIVNVRPGLTDRQGRTVTSVEIIGDDYCDEKWAINGVPSHKRINVRAVRIFKK